MRFTLVIRSMFRDPALIIPHSRLTPMAFMGLFLAIRATIIPSQPMPVEKLLRNRKCGPMISTAPQTPEMKPLSRKAKVMFCTTRTPPYRAKRLLRPSIRHSYPLRVNLKNANTARAIPRAMKMPVVA